MGFPAGNSSRGSQRAILSIGEPVLRRVARAVELDELAGAQLQQLIDDVIETMRVANGAGLAAPQIGESVRICAIEVNHNPRYPYKPNIPLTVLVNPTWTRLTEELFVNNEGCLSVPGIRGDVARFTHIRVEALGRYGERLDFTVGGLSAGTYQHECDHLDGVLFVDRVADPTSLCTWENFERYRRQEYLLRAADLVARFGQ